MAGKKDSTFEAWTKEMLHYPGDKLAAEKLKEIKAAKKEKKDPEDED